MTSVEILQTDKWMRFWPGEQGLVETKPDSADDRVKCEQSEQEQGRKNG